MDSAKRTISGTWGEVWLEGEKVAECYGLQAKASYNKEDVPMCGTMSVGSKVKSIKLTGSLRLHKTSSRMALLLAEKIQAGQDVRCTIISKLADPDAYGAERVALKDVSFDDLTIADWEADTFGKVECPFTFTSFEYLDTITPQ